MVATYNPDRYWEELYDHKRLYELSLWYGEGEAEIGVVFSMNAKDWDGEFDKARLAAVMADRVDFITFQMETSQRIWDLADLSAARDYRASVLHPLVYKTVGQQSTAPMPPQEVEYRNILHPVTGEKVGEMIIPRGT